ncbi:MAG TPA: hypothetical protein PKJ95_02675 [Atribacterota bacterium]|nr:hypothetical protein [Atribacterota bacterium]
MMDWMEPADRIIKFTHDILDFCASDPDLFLEMIQERNNFLTKNPEKYNQTEDLREIADLKFEDYYIYFYTSKYYRKIPLKVFLLKMLSQYNPQEQKILKGFQNNILSSFYVKEAFPGVYFIVEDLISGNQYKIREDQSLFQMKKNDYFIGRILPYETGYALSCVYLYLQGIPYDAAKKFWGNLPIDFLNKINPLDIEKIFIKQGMESEYVEDNWNLTPRDDFQGKSPEEMVQGSIGPLEKKLSGDFKKYILENMSISKFSDKDTLEKAIKEFQEKWLNKSQEELKGKTHLQVIKEERERLDSPRKDFPILFNIKPLDLGSQNPFNLDDINEEDSPVARDMEIFVSYIQGNRIKVTKKNCWIPFKHLKLIEKNFINPEKDGFLFLGKEEETGKETRKKYIHFIHLLSRAAKFIYHDKKGYIQVNHKHFKKFTQNNYGEKTNKLLIDWIEKVNWVKLQPTEYTTFNAQDYQENIVNIWVYLYHLKTDKKKTLVPLLKEMYWELSMEQEKFNNIVEDLGPTVQKIILRYLKWFGVIDTIEKLIFPDLGIRIIKRFWITPKGKKLIGRVLMDFWEKGKIQ